MSIKDWSDKDKQNPGDYVQRSGRVARPVRRIGLQLKRPFRALRSVGPAIQALGGLDSALKKAVRVYRREGIKGLTRRLMKLAVSIRLFPPSLKWRGSMESEFDPSRENVLVVSHEASRSGAPILSLNLVRLLRHRYNVLVLALGGGPLISAFRDEGAVVMEQHDIRHHPSLARPVVEKLLRKRQFRFALVNSIESTAVLPALAQHYVATISLLHEFAAYTPARDAFPLAFFWSGEAVFSAKLTFQSALDRLPPDFGKLSTCILPQGRCLLPKEKIEAGAQAAERERLRLALRPHGESDDTFVVLGAGYVILRKGVDLFIDCAAHVIRSHPARNIRFVWIGPGYDPDHDSNYSVYLADQIQRAGMTQHITFIDETSEMDEVYKAADLLLLSSRLDPLPNVAIDALSEGLPVMCFEKTTGIADILMEGGLQEDCVAEYLDTHMLAKKIIRLADDTAGYQDAAAKCKQLAVSTFDMEHYFDELERLVESVAKQTEQEARDVAEIIKSNLLDQDFYASDYYASSQNIERPPQQLAREYVRAWVAGIWRRKPFPGFHPGVYRERHGVSAQGADPFADYLRAGAPAGPWQLPVIRNTDVCRPVSGNARIALHLHVFYPELLPEILDRLRGNEILPDLFVSVASHRSAAEVEQQLGGYPGRVIAVETVPNRGRDIGPFLTTFGQRIAENYDFVGHLHTKKTVQKESSIGAAWYRFLLENLLGGKSGAMMDRILGYMSNTPEIGMVFPDDPNVVGWTANKPFALDLAGRLGIKELPEHFVFPMGTMFWARVEALKRFWALGLEWNDYPEEPLPYDGSTLHALERLFPLALAEGVDKCALTYVAGVSR